MQALFYFRWLLLLNLYVWASDFYWLVRCNFFFANWSLQVITEQLMAKVMCGGICGDKRLSLSRDQISWSWLILQMLSFPIWFSKIHHFGTSIPFTAGKQRRFKFTGIVDNISLWFMTMHSLGQHQTNSTKISLNVFGISF